MLLVGSLANYIRRGKAASVGAPLSFEHGEGADLSPRRILFSAVRSCAMSAVSALSYWTRSHPKPAGRNCIRRFSAM
jgi:hypothetical protein